jgi:hypothetical protein
MDFNTRVFGNAVWSVLLVLTFASLAIAQDLPTVYITPTEEGFEVYMSAAISKKKVPIHIVEKAEDAQYVLKAARVEEEKVTTGKRLVNCLFAYCAGNEDKASVSVTLVREGRVVWSYAVNKGRGSKNRQSMAEAVAKHMKDEYFKERR